MFLENDHSQENQKPTNQRNARFGEMKENIILVRFMFWSTSNILRMEE